MRLPSVEALSARAWQTFVRFPVPLLAAGAIAALLLIIVEDVQALELLVRGVLALALVVPLVFASDVLAERGGPSRFRRLVWAAALLGSLLFFLASRGWSEVHVASRFLQLFLAVHLLVAFLPFAGTREENGFWQFNRFLFLRFAIASVYTGVLFVGLVIALVSIDTLFGVDIGEESYGRLFIVLAFVAHPWIVFSGTPRDVSALEQEREYPAALKVFAQFVLIPLVSVYLCILTAYLVRVVVTGEWPSGWIGWLVSSVSVAGTLALLLVHPVRDLHENRWVNGYARWFWVALMPSIVMLFLAIGKRIGQYGFTENRYFLSVLACWIAGLSVYFAVTRSRRIRIVPISLFALAVITFMGPWGAYSVAERSQVNRLRSLLESAGVADLSAAEGATASVSQEGEREISAVLRYLFETRGHAPVEALLGEGAIHDHPADPAVTGTVADHGYYAEEDAKYAADFLGIRYVNQWEGTDVYAAARAEPPVFPAPTGYSHTLRVTAFTPDGPTTQVAGHSVRLVLPGGHRLRVEADSVTVLEIDLGEILRSADDTSVGQPWDMRVPPARMVFEGARDQVRVRLHVLNVGGRVTADSVDVQNAEGDLFVSFSGSAVPPGSNR